MVDILPHWNWEDQELADNVADAENKIPDFGFLDQDENWVPSVFNQLHF